MKFRHKRQSKELDLNITPLIDIVFLLLIFFMVSTNFKKFTQINLSLPEVSRDYSAQDLKSINIKITARGSYFVNDMPLSHNDKKTLRSAIKRLSSNNRKLAFIVSGDSNAPHQSVVTALDVAGELGYKNVRIAAVKTS